MKIGILVEDITKLGGVETVSVWLSERLSDKYEVYIISCKKSNSDVYNTSDKLKILFLGMNNSESFKNERIYQLKKLLSDNGITKLIIQLGTAFKSLCILADYKLYREIKTVSDVYVCIHESPKYFLKRYNINHDSYLLFLLKKIYHKLKYIPQIHKYFYESSKCINSFITLSKGCHDELLKYYGIDSIIKYNCYPFNYINIDYEHKENIILWAGRMSPEKNVRLLLEAWEKIENKKDWKLFLIGSGDEREYISQIIYKNAIQNVELLPPMEHSKLMEIFKKSKIYVLTSYFEGFPTVITEAMNYGNAVITTKYDGFSDELIGDGTGFIVEYDSDILKQTIELLISDEQLLIEQQKASYDKCLRFIKTINEDSYDSYL